MNCPHCDSDLRVFPLRNGKFKCTGCGHEFDRDDEPYEEAKE